MKFKLVITARAISDLREIRDYIARHSPLNADLFLARMLDELVKIEASPESFAKAPEDEFVPFTLRQFLFKPYRILYRVVGQYVEVLHIRHGARLPAKPVDLESG